MKIKRYKQTTYETCLPVCLLLIAGQEVSFRQEMKLFIKGIKKAPDTYVLGIIQFFVEQYGFEVEVYIDNKYFWNFLKKKTDDRRICFIHQHISPKFLVEQSTPYILYIDNHLLGVYSHAPHFVVVESQDNERYTLTDPWSGRRRRINKEIIFKAVESLRSHLKFCPLVIKVKNVDLVGEKRLK